VVKIKSDVDKMLAPLQEIGSILTKGTETYAIVENLRDGVKTDFGFAMSPIVAAQSDISRDLKLSVKDFNDMKTSHKRIPELERAVEDTNEGI